VATSTIETDVQALIEDWANALRKKDAAAVVSLQTEDFVQFALAPPLRAEALDRDGLEDWFSSWDGPINYEIRDQTITRAADVAFSHSLNRMRATTTDGEHTDLWFRQTLCVPQSGRRVEDRARARLRALLHGRCTRGDRPHALIDRRKLRLLA
jgi:PhnB protein